jgi:GntR family transcriptional regulator/MocR family aminotransferase
MEFHVSLVGRDNLSSEIYQQLRQAILDGLLRPGDRLPPGRELARRLSVSRTTVTVAYDGLAAEGFLTARVGAGTFVREQVALAQRRGGRSSASGVLQARPVWDTIHPSTAFVRPARFDFRTGLPDASLFPLQIWRRLIARQLQPRAIGGGAYAHPAGDPDLRSAIARHIGIARGVEATADDVTVTNGTQQAIDILARVLLAPGDRVAVEDPGYAPPRLLLQSLGARVVGVPVDRDGLVVNALPARTRLVYTTPSHQYPLGVSMTLQRRIALLEWAELNDAAIIEDDYDSEFRFAGRPIEPLRALDKRGRVLYVGSFSKTMLPTLRLGFIVTPPSLRAAVHSAKYVTDWHTPLFIQQALARFIAGGDFARHIRKMNRLYQVRHELIMRGLKDFAEHLQVVPSAAGLHISALARTAAVEEIDAVVERAADASVALHGLSRFAVAAPARAGLVLGFGAIASADIAEGLRRLRSCFAVPAG